MFGTWEKMHKEKKKKASLIPHTIPAKEATIKIQHVTSGNGPIDLGSRPALFVLLEWAMRTVWRRRYQRTLESMFVTAPKPYRMLRRNWIEMGAFNSCGIRNHRLAFRETRPIIRYLMDSEHKQWTEHHKHERLHEMVCPCFTVRTNWL